MFNIAELLDVKWVALWRAEEMISLELHNRRRGLGCRTFATRAADYAELSLKAHREAEGKR